MRKYNEEGYLIVGERDCCERFEPEGGGLLCLRECWHCKWADFHKNGAAKDAKESICRYERNRKKETAQGSPIQYTDDIRAKMERDALTGLRNRFFVQSSVEIALTNGYGGVLMIFDLCDLSGMKDAMGEDAENSVILHFSEILKNEFRGEDIVARMDNSRFAVFVKGNIPEPLCSKKVEEIRELFYERIRDKFSESAVIPVSVGAAVLVKNGASFDELYKHAEKVLSRTEGMKNSSWRFYLGSGEEELDNVGDTV